METANRKATRRNKNKAATEENNDDQPSNKQVDGKPTKPTDEATGLESQETSGSRRTKTASKSIQNLQDVTDRKDFLSSFKFDVLGTLLLVLSVATRFYNLDQPNSIVFDELHYGRYASHYLKGTFFYDTHPPLGKQLIALAGYLAGYDGNFKFDKIGSPYNGTVPVFALRSIPAASGSLLVPLAYLIMKQLGFSRLTAAFAGFLILIDNSLLTQSHYILMEPVLLLFAMTGLLCVLKYRKLSKNQVFSLSWWSWLLSAGFFLSCATCVKYAGIYSFGLGFIIVAREFWDNIVGDLTLNRSQIILHGLGRAIGFVFLPIAVYVAVFYVHLTVLTQAGPHDSVMSTAFQASLEGGLGSILRGQPLEVVHGSQVTLRHTHGIPCWLHGQQKKYPVRYPDKRGSSHQQIVSCCAEKDVNNWWIVQRPGKSDLAVSVPLDKIQHGDLIQLVHGVSGRKLNSHNVAAPVSPTKQEVSCYIDLKVSMAPMDVWKVEILNKEESGNFWHAVKSHVRLIHVNTSSALSFTGRVLPSWGDNQQEIAADPMINHQNTIFNVEEHRYTRNEDETDRQNDILNSEFVPLEPTKLSFVEKFFELQMKMLFVTNEEIKNHKYTSSPWEWLTLKRGIAYWISSDSNAQIHLLGNFFTWYSASVALTLYCSLLLFYLLRQRRQCYDISTEEWNQKFLHGGEVLLLGYCFHFVPYFFVDYALFLHHYLPALVFKLMITAAVLEHVYYLITNVFNWKLLERLFKAALFVWTALSLIVFEKYTPLCYGTGPMTADDILELKLKDTWDFIIHKS